MENARLRRPWLILAILALVAGLGTSVWFARRAERARNAAEADAAHARRIEKFTESLFTDGEDRVPPKDMTAEALLARGVKRARTLNDDPPEQADLLQTLGGVYGAMGSFDIADHLLLDALHEQEHIFGSSSAEVARTLMALSSLREEQGRARESLDLAQRAYAIDARALPPDDPETLEAQIKTGAALTDLGEYQKSTPILQSVIQKERGRPDRLAALSEAIGELSIAEFYQGHAAAALPLDIEGLAIDRQMLGNAHPDVGSDLINLSQLETQAGDYAKAEAYGREALAIYRGWFSPGHYEIAGAETTLSDPLIYQGKVQEALPLLVDALRIQQASFPGPNEKTAHTLASLGHAEHALNRLDDSLAYYQKAAAQFLSLIPGKDYRFASMLFNEGKVYKEQGRLPQAESVLRDALSVDTLRLPATDKRVLDIRLLLGEVLLEEHQLTAAQPFLTQAYKDASSAGPACETERETAEKELRSLSVAKSIPTRNP